MAVPEEPERPTKPTWGDDLRRYKVSDGPSRRLNEPSAASFEPPFSTASLPTGRCAAASRLNIVLKDVSVEELLCVDGWSRLAKFDLGG